VLIAGSSKRPALAKVGGGEVSGLERDGEKGAVYEVEVTKPDGSQVDVRIGSDLQVVAVDGDSEDAGEQEGR
jgi:uncharacterized membrane protein YkoI